VGVLLKSFLLHSTCEVGKEQVCQGITSTIDTYVNSFPYNPIKANPTFGEVDFPPFPPSYPECMLGYVLGSDGNCYLKGYIAWTNSLCEETASCSTPTSDMCSDGWTGTCHGTCFSCHNDCKATIGEVANSMIVNGTLGYLTHRNTDPTNYFVCGLSGKWEPVLQAATNSVLFNTGRGRGRRDIFNCVIPTSTALLYCAPPENWCPTILMHVHCDGDAILDPLCPAPSNYVVLLSAEGCAKRPGSSCVLCNCTHGTCNPGESTCYACEQGYFLSNHTCEAAGQVVMESADPLSSQPTSSSCVCANGVCLNGATLCGACFKDYTLSDDDTCELVQRQPIEVNWQISE